MKKQSVNEAIQDVSIQHMVWLERYKSSTVRKIIEMLNKADEDLVGRIAGRLSAIDERGFDLGTETTQRLRKMLDEIREMRVETMGHLRDATQTTLEEFAVYEADFQAKLIERSTAAVSAGMTLDRPALSQMRAIVTSQPFQGRLLREWYRDLATDDARRLSDAVKIGMTQGQTTDQIIRRIRGTKALNYSDGILDMSRRHVDSIVRTAVSHVANRSKDTLWQDNADVIEGLKVVATLDGKTTAYCRSQDGKVYAVGKAPIFPAHFRCRTALVPYLGETSIKGTRASAIGPVPADTTYDAWLKSQSTAVQNEVLGVKKAQLYRKGGLSLDRFSDGTGKEYTLAQLKKRDAEIWNKTFNA